ncbi:tyrosine-type recombinase/integrase [Bacteroides ovatus]|uniref:Tyrosine-type recombinase/integrase n=1 Tax=Bacteroides ovatus TaxID=28116 RepID=A0A5M5BBS8_BACOV|nr:MULTISPECIES: tyrosine-type recombinase/integrase [Bacteroides]UYI77100.1 MAG: tyrosine-type recombinase/integrase [Bacteroides xylanisolvens]KAA3915839.1 tyrosine-type recombinase/integrase [Bacteroides ovatus]KAA3921002.1 tyrosine-type recombinase/integrase [Bacteroides ovatus]KAA3965802.1 tyrosine-type recombinase/integrase [Bacteroides ovatus]KAB1328538.1 tyrosine-type recombinase/integrase [Bacteroides ovatus]
MPSFPKQAANSLVTETSQYFVFFCRSVCSAILAKCLIINVLRLIIVILFFIAFLNITYMARHTFATTITLSHGIPIETVSKMLGHTSIKTTQIYAKILDTKVMDDMAALKELYTRKESQKSPDNKAVNG